MAEPGLVTVPASPPSVAASLPAPAARAVAQLQGLAANPLVVAARPAIIAALVLMTALIGWSVTRQQDWRPLYSELSDGDKSAVIAALEAGNYKVRVNPDSGTIEVGSGDVAAARILLAGQGLPKAARSLDAVGDMPMGLSRAVEAARLKGAMASELAASIESIDGVKRATVHVALPEPSVFVRDRAPASASVFVALAPGRVLGEAQVRAIVWLVSSSVAGLAPERVSVVDQSGALLSAGVAASEAAQLGYQARVEAMVRERLNTLLTPLIGQGRFTAEVTADVDFTRSESASERFERDGSVLRSEQASRSMEAAPPPARGIPGALSNTAPAAAQIAATPPADTVAAPGATPQITAETTNRAWEIGKDVRVSRGDAPRIRRLSVAVVIDRSAMLKDGKLPPGDVAALQRLISGAIGRDLQRGDQLELVLRDFVAPQEEPSKPWFAPETVRDYTLPIIAALLLLAGIGYGGWRWRASRKARAVAANAPHDGGTLTASNAEPEAAKSGEPTATTETGPAADSPVPRLVDYSEKLDATRSLVSGDTDRATAVARQMLAIDLATPDEDEAG
ncbi:flagellar basal-body MS-ring/collar protein FliF [Polymorphobacter sp.]|uniref:flagellar basal-body MS-ring/collar protein FliF n=1 Tax=Polymorphobacter sp. TaxID=1909290 RepID=UPI003F708C42